MCPLLAQLYVRVVLVAEERGRGISVCPCHYLGNLPGLVANL